MPSGRIRGSRHRKSIQYARSKRLIESRQIKQFVEESHQRRIIEQGIRWLRVPLAQQPAKRQQRQPARARSQNADGISAIHLLDFQLAPDLQQVADAFLQQIVIQPFQQWIAMQARMLALKLGFIQQEQVADASASAAKVAQKSAETTTVVSMDAAKAGAGAAASQASIPYVGPALAVAAMVAMVAAVMALLGGIKKFAGGGFVSGPGSATSDSIPARLSAGEYVVRAAAVRQVGVAFLDSLNGLSAGPRFTGGELAFAAGGLVPEVKVPPAQPQVSQAVRIVNAVDPGVTHDHLQSPAGEKVIVNIIGRNARAIRAALQG